MSQQKYSDKAAIAAHQNVKEGEYWRERLAGANSTGFNVCGDRTCAGEKQVDAKFPSNAYEPIVFSPAQCDRLMKLRNKNDIRLNMVLVAGVTALLNKYTGTGDVVVCVPIYIQKSGTDFINTVLPLRSTLTVGMSFKELLLQIRKSIEEAVQHQNYPMQILAEQLNLHESNGGFPFADTMAILENVHDCEYVKDTHVATAFVFNRGEESSPAAGTTIEGKLHYDPRIFSQAAIERVIEHFLIIMEKGLSDVNRPLNELEMITPNEKNQILETFNTPVFGPGTIGDAGAAETGLHCRISEQAAKTPDGIAVIGNRAVDNDGPQAAGNSDAAGNPVHLTYRQLEMESAKIASMLKTSGIGPGCIVGLMVSPCLEMAVGILGILKAGGAYLPMDTDYPEERITFMLTDGNAQLLLTTRKDSTEIYFDKKILYLEDLPIGTIGFNQSRENGDIEKTLRETTTDTTLGDGPTTQGRHLIKWRNVPAYVIYTSGSTGRPKGVLVEHGNVNGYLDAFFQEFHITDTDTSIQLTSFAFDAFVEEFYPVLMKGGKIAIPTESESVGVEHLAHFLLSRQVTIIDCTPLLLNEFNKLDLPYNLRIVISGGDVLKAEYVTNFVRQGIVHNTYGPTESTVCASYYRYTGATPQEAASIPIGRPIEGYTVLILDTNHHLMPVGVPGELHIAGPGITRGYLNRPLLTSEKFIRLPHKNTPPHGTQAALCDGNPMFYKTGDRGRWLTDGNIEFLGRIDNQVKIRGFRIETGEIENRLKKHPGVSEAVVVQRNDHGDKNLCACILPQNSESTEEDKHTLTDECKELLAKELPAYMIPSF
ncbi:MAG: amino acid adenylation domain-containing protein, partial [bacterium]|nr:amino acid adenylation domain-containing protein [bacterium]